jgi:4-aminobutyrate aminotransferase-like enzyme
MSSSETAAPDPVSGWVARGDLVYSHPTVPRFTRAWGVVLEDDAGRRYLDAEASSGTAGLGFDSTILTTAAQRAAAMPVLPSFCESSLRQAVAARLAARLREATGRQGRVAFELGGAQGVELALKVVRGNTSRPRFVVFEGGYHGRSGLTAQLSASPRYRRGDGAGLPVTRLPYPDVEQARFGEAPGQAATTALAYVRQLATMEFAGLAQAGREPEVAALVVEPILNAGGVVRPDPRYLCGVVEIFRSLGALIVVDEIFCGFHRTGPAWGFQHYQGIDPDVVVLGKALTNGITPLTCVWAREPLMGPDHFPPGSHSATYQATPLALAVADEVLDRYDRWQDREAQVARVEAGLRAAIDHVVRAFPMALSGWASGGLGRIRLDRPLAGRAVELARRVADRAPVGGFHGLILGSPGMAPSVIALNPPLVISDPELHALRELLVRTFDALAAAA